MREEENALTVPAFGSPGVGGCSRAVSEEHGESGEPEREPGLGSRECERTGASLLVPGHLIPVLHFPIFLEHFANKCVLFLIFS